jgi:hypothetical protein
MMHPNTPISLTAKEIARADHDLTVVVRKQANGRILVAAVRIVNGQGLFLGRTYSNVVDKKYEVPAAVKDVVRWLSKMGYPSEMSLKSRHR